MKGIKQRKTRKEPRILLFSITKAMLILTRVKLSLSSK